MNASDVDKPFSFTQIMKDAHQQVDKTDYFQKRGLNITIQRYQLGYAEEGMNFLKDYHKKFAGLPNEYQKYRIFLPIWDANGECCAMTFRTDEEDVNPRYRNLSGFPVHIFNERYLVQQDKNIIFLVEGIFDALSIEEFYYSAMAVNGSQNISKLKALLKKHQKAVSSKTIILIPDRDAAGDTMKQKFIEIMQAHGIRYQVAELSDDKDVNQFLVRDRNGLQHFLSKIVHSVIERDEETESPANGNMAKDSLLFYLPSYREKLFSNPLKPISTGFMELDAKLSGGLIPGLYVLGAISALGKTALMHQVADQIAMAGTPVLFFSLEMGTDEMISRSLSRTSYFQDPSHAYSSLEIVQQSISEEQLINLLLTYEQTAMNLSLIEGNKDLDIFKIRKEVEEFSKQYPQFVVFVDYLQIINPPQTKSLSEKQVVDFHMTQLKQISRDFHVPVLTISSFNRMNYGQIVGFESFKESGGIEYSADVVMGLQLQDLGKIASEKDETKRRRKLQERLSDEVRRLELVVLKQRNGQAFGRVNFAFHPRYNHFCVVAPI